MSRSLRVAPWAPTARLWLLSFDISEPKQRRRFEKIMKGLGFVSTQYSLRLAMLTPGEVRRLKQALKTFPTEGFHAVLLPLGDRAPQALTWGTPLGMSQSPWGELPGHSPCLHVAYP